MTKQIGLFLSLHFFLVLGLFAGNEYVLDHCRFPESWKFTLGGEFKGARGALESSETGLMTVRYDFSQGGKYVGVSPAFSLPSEIETFFFKFSAEQDCCLNYRIVDASGRYFQGKKKVVEKSAESVVRFSTSGPWSAAWGGTAGKMPVKPYKNFFLTVNAKDGLPLQGRVELRAFGITSEKKLTPKFSGEGGGLTACGWRVEARWIPRLSGALLEVDAETEGKEEVELSIDFPEMGRDSVFRKTLAKSGKVYYCPPLQHGGNSRNRYNVILKIAGRNGTCAQTFVPLVGCDSGNINFGAPVSAADIQSSRVGVCTHFSFGTHPVFHEWAPYEKLIDGIAECGYKWIRDGVDVEKQEDGSWKVREYDLKWIRYAKSKGIGTIALIRLYPDKTIDEYKRYAEAVVRDTQGLVRVFELGNEPNNFGWKKKFGGHWNGWDPKTKQVDTWVKEHLKYTNALADHLKERYTEITLIGLGAVPSTNTLAIREGLSRNVDGIAEHPYTYSLPPERIPFSKAHEKRDGVKVTDNGTFDELISHFEKLSEETGRKRSLWLTEFGFTSFWFDGKTEKGLYAGFSEEAQAVYLVRRFIHGLAYPSIAVACQYDYINDYGGKAHLQEGNFGSVRPDHSRKPAYYAIQRMNSLFNGYEVDQATEVVVEAQLLHRSCKRGVLVKDWDSATMKAGNGIKAYAFSNPSLQAERMLAVWSAQPYSREFNNRTCTLRVRGVADYDAQPLAIDIITGRSYDLPTSFENGDIVFRNLFLKGNPIVIKIFK